MSAPPPFDFLFSHLLASVWGIIIHSLFALRALFFMRSAHTVLLGIQLADDDGLEGWGDGFLFFFLLFCLGMDVFSMTGGNGGGGMGGLVYNLVGVGEGVACNVLTKYPEAHRHLCFSVVFCSVFMVFMVFGAILFFGDGGDGCCGWGCFL